MSSDNSGSAPQVVSDLADAEYNPRVMSRAQHKELKLSMEKFGDLSGIVFNVRTGRTVGAHQRKKHLPKNADIVLHGARQAPNKQGTIATGYVEVDGERWSYREVDVDEQTEKAMNLAANKHSGEWETGMLTEVLGELDGLDFPIGFDDVDIDALLGKAGAGVPEDLGPSELDQRYSVLVSCNSEDEQVQILEELTKRGMACRALIL